MISFNFSFVFLSKIISLIFMFSKSKKIQWIALYYFFSLKIIFFFGIILKFDYYFSFFWILENNFWKYFLKFAIFLIKFVIFLINFNFFYKLYSKICIFFLKCPKFLDFFVIWNYTNKFIELSLINNFERLFEILLRDF